jgi:hypothetical protein
MSVTITPITIPDGLKKAIAEVRAAVREWCEEHGDSGSMNAQTAAWYGKAPIWVTGIPAAYLGSVPHHVGRNYTYCSMHDPVREMLVQAMMDGTAEIEVSGVWLTGIGEDEASERISFDGENWHKIPPHVEVEADGADHIEDDGTWHVYNARLRSRIVSPYED